MDISQYMYYLQLCQLTQQQISSQQWISNIECNAGDKRSIRSWFLYILHLKLLVSKIWSNAGDRFKHIIYTVYLWHFLPMLCLTFKDFFLILSVGVFTWEENYICVPRVDFNVTFINAMNHWTPTEFSCRQEKLQSKI